MLNRAIAFDFDGTLIDSKNIKTENYCKAFEMVFKTGKEKRPIIIESCEQKAGANRFIQLQDTLQKLNLNVTNEQKQNWSHIYSLLNKKSLQKITEFPAVRKILNELRKNYHLFAISGILHDEFLQELSKRNLIKYFIESNGGDKTSFLISLKERRYSYILFVGDTNYDKQIACDVGVDFYMINTNNDFLELINYLHKKS